MAVVLIEGFDYITDDAFLRKWYSSGWYNMQTSTRFNVGKCLRLYNGGTHRYFLPNGLNSQAFNISFSFYPENTADASTFVILTDGVNNQVSFGIDSALRPILVRGNSTVIFTSSKRVPWRAWSHVECYFVISPSTGENQAVVRINGVEVINAPAGTNTRATSNSYADGICLFGVTPYSAYIDDLVLSTESVTTTPTFNGDRRVQTLYPNGNGNYSQFVGSDGNSVDNYLLVDDPWTDPADYVGSSTAGHKDSYAFTNLNSTTSSISTVQLTGHLYRSDSGARTGKLFYRISGTDYESSAINPATSPVSYNYIAETNPATAAAWAIADVNNLECGVKVET